MMPDAIEQIYNRQVGKDQIPAAAADWPAETGVSWLDRVGSIFGKKKQDARATYLRLLRKAEVEGKQLGERELVEMQEAMERANITPEHVDAHRRIIQDYFHNKRAAERTTADEERVAETKKMAAELTAQIDLLLAKRKPYDEVVRNYISIAGDADAARQRFANSQELFTQLLGEIPV